MSNVAEVGRGRDVRRKSADPVLLGPFSSVGRPRSGFHGQHYRPLPRSLGGSRGRTICELCALHTPHRSCAEELAECQPRTLAAMHGSSFVVDGSQALRDLANVMADVLGPGSAANRL